MRLDTIYHFQGQEWSIMQAHKILFYNGGYLYFIYGIKYRNSGNIHLGIFSKKGLAFEKIDLSKSKINSDETTKITINVKNFKEKFDDIAVLIKTDDETNQYLQINKPTLRLPSLDFPNRNTGDQEVVINPINIPVQKMSFKISVEVYVDNAKKLMLKKEFTLTVNKK